MRSSRRAVQPVDVVGALRSARREARLTWSLILLCSIAVAASQATIPTWTPAAPIISIESDGTASTEFSRIEGAARLSNRYIAVANGATNEIRLFDEQGRYVSSFGRSGAGPGEFGSLGWIGRSGDTAFVFDAHQERITTVLLAPQPRLLNTLRVTATGKRGRFYVSGRFADGRWLVETFTSPGWDGPPGVHRLPGSVGIIGRHADGDVTWLGEFKNLAVFVHNPTGNLKNAAVGPIAFGPALRAAASGTSAWLGDSEGDSLSMFSRDGKRQSVHLPFRRRSLTQSAVDGARQGELATARSDVERSWVNAKYSANRLPRALPYFQALIPGPRGEIWVQEYAEVAARSVRYLVLESNMRTRAWVSLPPGVRVAEVGSDYLIGVHEDADGVESVRVYRLARR